VGRSSRANLKRKEAIATRKAQADQLDRELRSSLLHMRQMYESAVQEKQQMNITNQELLLTIACLLLTKSKGKGTAVLTPEVRETALGVDGVTVVPDGDNIILTIVDEDEEDEETDGEES
jgi:hypothetical protein